MTQEDMNALRVINFLRASNTRSDGQVKYVIPRNVIRSMVELPGDALKILLAAELDRRNS